MDTDAQTAEALWEKRLVEESRLSLARWSRWYETPGVDRALGIGTILGALLALTGLRGRGERNAAAVALRNRTFRFPNLPAAFDGFRILHLSDLHFGPHAAFGEQFYDVVGEVEVDLCVLTGDFHRRHLKTCDPTYQGMARLVPAIRARQGIVGVLGNHDLSGFVEPFRDLGVRMLINESFEVRRDADSLWLMGVDDPHDFRCAGLDCALRGVPEGAFHILLVHSPELVAEAERHRIDLYLCGHTHGGQVCLPGLGALSFNTRAARRYCRGAWRRGNLQGYTTLGVGATEAPVRFNCPPEAAVIELRKESR